MSVSMLKRHATAFGLAMVQAARSKPVFPYKACTESGLEEGDSVTCIRGKFANGSLIGTIVRFEDINAFIETSRGMLCVPVNILILAL